MAYYFLQNEARQQDELAQEAAAGLELMKVKGST